MWARAILDVAMWATGGLAAWCALSLVIITIGLALALRSD
jgi:hypothetical protein